MQLVNESILGFRKTLENLGNAQLYAEACIIVSTAFRHSRRLSRYKKSPQKFFGGDFLLVLATIHS